MFPNLQDNLVYILVRVKNNKIHEDIVGGLIITRLGGKFNFKDKTFQQVQFPMAKIHSPEVTGHSQWEMII